MSNPEAVLKKLFDAYAVRDAVALHAVLSNDLRAWVTNAEGGVKLVQGNDTYIKSLLSLEAPVFHIALTQLLRVSDNQAMAMAEIRAERNGKTLHNFAAFLARVEQDKIAELWMVEALPADSAEFWS